MYWAQTFLTRTLPAMAAAHEIAAQASPSDSAPTAPVRAMPKPEKRSTSHSAWASDTTLPRNTCVHAHTMSVTATVTRACGNLLSGEEETRTGDVVDGSTRRDSSSSCELLERHGRVIEHEIARKHVHHGRRSACREPAPVGTDLRVDACVERQFVSRAFTSCAHGARLCRRRPAPRQHARGAMMPMRLWRSVRTGAPVEGRCDNSILLLRTSRAAAATQREHIM